MKKTFSDFDATELFCPQCKKAVPVRKKLLLILPQGEKYDYSCILCGCSVGDKTVREKENSKLTIN